MTYTFAIMTVSRSTYDEVKKKLKEAGWEHAIGEDGHLDMRGVALTTDEAPTDKTSKLRIAKDETITR